MNIEVRSGQPAVGIVLLVDNLSFAAPPAAIIIPSIRTNRPALQSHASLGRRTTQKCIYISNRTSRAEEANRKELMVV